MLILCEDCQRQFDVSGVKPGEKVRCLCGELLEVPEVRSHEARTLHCASCGGKLRESASECEYCGGAITAEERNLGTACPKCYARLLHGARFCRECGLEIRPERIQARPIDSKCPRCCAEMVLCTVPGGHYTECSGCGGLWLDAETFDTIVEQRDESPVGKQRIAERRKQHVDEATSVNVVKYLPCPVCSQLMHRRNFATCSGVIIDWCKEHGFWFDTHELEKVIDFIAGGGMDRAREAELRRQKSAIEQAKKRQQAISKSLAAGGHRPTGHGSFHFGSVPDSSLGDLIGFLGTSISRFLKL